MKALSVVQPWAAFLASGVKQYETRSWRTAYRGPIAIHASLRVDRVGREVFEQYLVEFEHLLNPWGSFDALLRGKVIGIARLVDVVPTESESVGPRERFLGDWTPGRWAWRFEGTEPIEPADALGSLGLWEWPY